MFLDLCYNQQTIYLQIIAFLISGKVNEFLTVAEERSTIKSYRFTNTFQRNYLLHFSNIQRSTNMLIYSNQTTTNKQTFMEIINITSLTEYTYTGWATCKFILPTSLNTLSNLSRNIYQVNQIK